MIILEVEVPILGKKYDFQIDEETPLGEVKEEITELICRKEQCTLNGETGRLLLYLPDGKRLNQALSARECALFTGDSVILV